MSKQSKIRNLIMVFTNKTFQYQTSNSNDHVPTPGHVAAGIRFFTSVFNSIISNPLSSGLLYF